MNKTLSMHPLVKGISPSQWARLCDARRAYENRKAVRDAQPRKLHRVYLIEADEKGEFPSIATPHILQIIEVERTREQAEELFSAAARKADEQ